MGLGDFEVPTAQGKEKCFAVIPCERYREEEERMKSQIQGDSNTWPLAKEGAH